MPPCKPFEIGPHLPRPLHNEERDSFCSSSSKFSNNTHTIHLQLPSATWIPPVRSAPRSLLGAPSQRKATSVFPKQLQLDVTKCPVFVFKNTKQNRAQAQGAFAPGKMSISSQTTPDIMEVLYSIIQIPPHQECLKGDREILGARKNKKMGTEAYAGSRHSEQPEIVIATSTDPHHPPRDSPSWSLRGLRLMS